jgi:glutamate-1-semialdehyde 2,1-aminomutase
VATPYRTRTVTGESLLAGLRAEYTRAFPRSAAAHACANEVLIDGVSHGARLADPYPVYADRALGAHVTDLDGHALVDYWQGHYANILGHNPPLVCQALAAELQRGNGLQTGMAVEAEAEFARLLLRATGDERVRFTTAGTLATMYALMLARAYTGRKLVTKVTGGWHGANPLALKGVHRTAGGFAATDSAGMSASVEDEVVVVRFNDVEGLQALFRQRGEAIAALILEPCMGAAGFTAATRPFMQAARDLTSQYGALLILDEVITGFRFCASGAQRLYGVRADLSTYGKIIGGGMPLSAVVGRADLLDLASDKRPDRVWFNGGTFSAHALTLVAGLTLVEYLVRHEAMVYPALEAKMARLRAGIEAAFAARGVLARCTRDGSDGFPAGSIAATYFPKRDDWRPLSAEDMTDPALCDVTMKEKALKLGLLMEGVNVAHGLGAMSLAHEDADIDRTIAAFEAFARRASA